MPLLAHPDPGGDEVVTRPWMEYPDRQTIKTCETVKNPSETSLLPQGAPDMTVKIASAFGLDTTMEVPGYSERGEHVPDVDDSYVFDPQTTLAILAGFAHNRRVMIQGYHGTGKSTHIEQVAARLNWPCIRVNLDSHISRIDLIGKDAIILRDGMQVTEFREGILPWAIQNPVALVFDEYDAGRPDVMFVIQRVLEVQGKMTLLDQNRVIVPHPSFRLFSTANTVGLGDTTGLYHGTQQINQGQMDRWSIVSTLNYLEHEEEEKIVLSKVPHYATTRGPGDHRPDGGRRRTDARRLRRRRHLDRHVAQDGDHLGGERGHLRRHRLRLSADLPQQVRRNRAFAGRGILSALLRIRDQRGRRRRNRSAVDRQRLRRTSPGTGQQPGRTLPKGRCGHHARHGP